MCVCECVCVHACACMCVCSLWRAYPAIDYPFVSPPCGLASGAPPSMQQLSRKPPLLPNCLQGPEAAPPQGGWGSSSCTRLCRSLMRQRAWWVSSVKADAVISGAARHSRSSQLGGCSVRVWTGAAAHDKSGGREVAH